MLSKYSYVIYSWFTTILFAGLIIWIASIPDFEVSNDLSNEVVKVLFRMILYSFLFILFYRSLIATFKSSVQRLAHWRSKSEAAEDAEFVLIIETLLVIISVLAVSLFSVFEQFIQLQVPGRSGIVEADLVTTKLADIIAIMMRNVSIDVLLSVMAVLLSALVVYSIPVIGELEMAIKHYYLRSQNRAKHKQAHS
jgi:hypothetical protein